MSERKKNKSVDISTMIYGKVPPQATELERAVLGAIMIERDAYSNISEILHADCFYVDAHQRLFRAFKRLALKHSPIDELTVAEDLKSNEELELIGGVYYITSLTRQVVSSANIISHAKIVFQKWIQRAIIKTCGEGIGDAYEDYTDPFDLIEDVSGKIKAITHSIAEKNKIDVSDIAMDVLNKFETKVYNAKNNIVDTNSVYTGIPNWDKLNGAMCAGLYFVGARPGMGKTVHMVQSICNTSDQHASGIISNDTSNDQIIKRLATNIGEIDNFLFKKDARLIEDSEVANLYLAMEEVQMMNFKIDNSRYVDKVIQKMSYWVEKENVKKVYIDVLGKVKVPPEKERYLITDLQRINYVIEELSVAAIKLNLPIIVYTHLNRGLYNRTNKEPNLSDFKGSGNIEDFGVQLSVLHRPEYYDIFEDEHGESTRGLMYQIVLKHREGAVDRLKHRFYGQFSKLGEWDRVEVKGWQPIETTPF